MCSATSLWRGIFPALPDHSVRKIGRKRQTPRPMEELLNQINPLTIPSSGEYFLPSLYFHRSFVKGLDNAGRNLLIKKHDLPLSFFADAETYFEEQLAQLGHNPKLETVCQRLEELLASGGDDRLTLVETFFHDCKVNKYYCSTVPRSDVISRGSCTCNSLTSQVSISPNMFISIEPACCRKFPTENN
jgi:hypothetical protein